MYQCQNCLQTFKWKYQMEKHVQSPCQTATINSAIHNVPEEISTESLPKSVQENVFTVPDSEEDASNTRIYNCTLCDYSTLKQHSLSRHIGRCHLDENDKKFECKECLRKFKLKLSLKRHIGHFHGRGKLYKCTECWNECYFALYNEFNRHMKNHGKKVALQCEECSEVLASSKDLHYHNQKYHNTTEQTFIPNANVQNSNIKIKFSPKTLQCKICFKHFMDADDLNFHMVNIHKTLQCDLCLEFVASKELENHKTEAHGQLELKSEIEVEEPTMVFL